MSAFSLFFFFVTRAQNTMGENTRQGNRDELNATKWSLTNKVVSCKNNTS